MPSCIVYDMLYAGHVPPYDYLRKPMCVCLLQARIQSLEASLAEANQTIADAFASSKSRNTESQDEREDDKTARIEALEAFNKRLFKKVTAFLLVASLFHLSFSHAIPLIFSTLFDLLTSFCHTYLIHIKNDYKYSTTMLLMMKCT